MNWEPFRLVSPGERTPLTRSIDTREGVGDRLRAAAFAEIQAREAFLWAAHKFENQSPEGLSKAWVFLAEQEQKHLDWLLQRMQDLKIEVQERPVSDQLWHSLISCQSARDFAHFMANAEERGRKAGVRFQQALSVSDPISAAIFGKIAQEEVSHIRLAHHFFPMQNLTPSSG